MMIITAFRHRLSGISLLVVCSLGFLVSFPQGPVAQDAMSTIPTVTKQIDQRLSKIEGDIADLQRQHVSATEFESYLKQIKARQQQLSDIANSLKDTELKIAESESTIGGQYFSIFTNTFGVLLTIAVALGALAVYLIQKATMALVLRKAEKYIANEISSRGLFAYNLAAAELYLQLSCTWYEHCETDFHAFLRSGVTESQYGLLREVQLARELADQGLKVFQSPQMEEGIKRDDTTWLTFAKLKNSWAYFRWAELRCKSVPADSENRDVSDLLDGADQCIKLAKDIRGKRKILVQCPGDRRNDNDIFR